MTPMKAAMPAAREGTDGGPAAGGPPDPGPQARVLVVAGRRDATDPTEADMRAERDVTGGVPAGKPIGADGAPEPGLQPRVLVVDDVFDNRDILMRRLSRRGFEVVEAGGGREALERIAQERFDVVLLDIMMPDLNGNEVLRAVRRTKTAAELPVIMVTAKSQSEDVVQSLSLGANDYVTKPVDFAVALARINHQVARKRAADAEHAQRRAAERRAADLRLVVEEWSETLRVASETLDQEEVQRRQSEERLRFLAYHDALTGLLNRTAFRERLGDALGDPARLARAPALLFLDLDRFKAVNDVYGHEVGDRLLQEVGARLRGVGGPGASLARLGGDEFAALVFEDGGEPASGRASRMVGALVDPFHIDGQQVRIGASCGIARVADAGANLDALAKAADIAMYRAKLAGRDGCVVFKPHMLEEARERNGLEVELRRAILDGALDVAYQPVVSSRTKRVTAFEALARWPHPTRGMIPPDVFIPLAEETGLIASLGAWVLRRACAEAATWPPEVRIAVNVSALQFRGPDLVPTIKDCLRSSGLDPGRLELEVTESALLEARAHNLEVFREIHEMGIRVSMDDFGTGYSSMAYLQSFEFDKIKLDRQFVRRAQAGLSNGALVRAIVELADSAGMETTAEGVETEEELVALTSHGCTEIQGNLLSRPLSAEDARAFAHANAGEAP